MFFIHSCAKLNAKGKMTEKFVFIMFNFEDLSLHNSTTFIWKMVGSSKMSQKKWYSGDF